MLQLCARSVLLILILAAGSLSPPGLRAQQSAEPPAEPSRPFSLEQNYPDPVGEETWIPFSLNEPLFASGAGAVVSLRIYNVLRQLVAVPETVNYPRGQRVPVTRVAFAEPGRRLAYWDGKDVAGRRVSSGVYYCELVVNDQPQIRKLIVLTQRRRRPNFFPWFGNKEDRS